MYDYRKAAAEIDRSHAQIKKLLDDARNDQLTIKYLREEIDRLTWENDKLNIEIEVLKETSE